MGQEINAVINNLSTKLGVAADKLYPVLVRQSYVDGVKALVWLVFSIILIRFFWKIYNNNKVVNTDTWEEADNKTSMQVICVVVIILMVIIVAIATDSAINCFGNPEFHALQKIFDMLPR